MQITKQIRIDMENRQLTEPAYAVQGDSNTRIISAMLLENNIPWEVPTGVTAAVAFQKPDKTKGLYDHLPDGSPAISISGNVVKAILAPQVLSCSGEVRASIVFHDSDLTQLATFPFYIDVAENPAAGQSVSNDYYRYSTMEEVNEAVEAALAALEAEKQEFLDKAEKALADVRNALEVSTPAIVCEASGEVISAADASDRPLKGLSIYGKTVQNGTPSPENPVPLESVGASGSIGVTVAGKNLIPYPYVTAPFTGNGLTVAYNADGIIMISGTATGNTYIVLANQDSDLNVNGQYILSGIDTPISGVGVQLFLDGTDQGNYLSGEKEYALSGKITRLALYVGKGTVLSNAVVKPMLRLASIQDSTYEPYKGQTLTASTPNGLPGIPVASGGNYTDENGQAWVCDEVDFARGVYVKRLHEETYDGTEGWVLAGDMIYIPRVKMGYLPKKATTALRCTHFIRLTGTPNVTMGGDWGITLAKHSYAGLEEWTAWLARNTITVMYEIETPIETPLTAEELAQYAALRTNYPNTTVFNDSGAGMKLSYVADTKNYIDNKLAAISAAVLNA